MKNIFNVSVLKFSNLLEIKGTWGPDDYRVLLEALEYDDYAELNDEELQEVCLMAMQDLEPEAAAHLVLKYKMGHLLKEGQIKNLSVEMMDEKLWEEYADQSLHEQFFNVGSLLYQAFPSTFPKPDAVSLLLEVTAENDSAKKLLAGSVDESFLVRLIADGMDDKTVLHRMFEDQIVGKSFPEAANIIWILNSEEKAQDKKHIEIISSGYWFDPLSQMNGFESSAYSDGCT